MNIHKRVSMNECVHSVSWKATSIETSHHHLRQGRLSHNFTLSVFCRTVATRPPQVSTGSAVPSLARCCMHNLHGNEPPPGFEQWPLSPSEGLQGAKFTRPCCRVRAPSFYFRGALITPCQELPAKRL